MRFENKYWPTAKVNAAGIVALKKRELAMDIVGMKIVKLKFPLIIFISRWYRSPNGLRPSDAK